MDQKVVALIIIGIILEANFSHALYIVQNKEINLNQLKI